MKSKKLYYILIFNLILFIGLIFNFYIKSQTGNGMFHGVSTWWNSVNSVKEKNNTQLMTFSSEPLEDPLEKAGKNSIETIKIEENIINNELNVVNEIKMVSIDEVVTEKEKGIEKNKDDVKAKKVEKEKTKNETKSEVNAKVKKEDLKNNSLVVSASVKMDSTSNIDDNTTFIAIEEQGSPLCVNYGPLNIEQKSSFNILLSKYKVPESLVKKTEDDLYEIIWNLGNNKETAVELFEKQKNEGALQDVRFKLKQDSNGNYIVPISTVAGNLSMANKMTQDLKNSSKNIGGIWEYRAIEKGYFYQISDIRKLDSELVNSINQVINTLKTTCS